MIVDYKYNPDETRCVMWFVKHTKQLFLIGIVLIHPG